MAETRKLYPEFHFDKFIGDGAHDNYPTYELLDAWDIKAIIHLNEKNKGNFKYPPPVKVNDNGAPVCLAGYSMVFWEYQKDRCRLKYRCPYALGRISSCPCKHQCSPSDYGRTVYIKPKWDLRLFTAIPRDSKQWKKLMKKRTSSERVNNRILNDYSLEQSDVRGKKRLSFWTMIHSFNIHLDARLKKSGFNFLSILDKLTNTAA